jgi:hypothetical protein
MNNIGTTTIIAQVNRRDVILGMFCLFLFSGFLYQGFVVLQGCEEKAHVLHLS